MDLWFALGQIICLIALAAGALISFKHSDLNEEHAAQHVKSWCDEQRTNVAHVVKVL